MILYTKRWQIAHRKTLQTYTIYYRIVYGGGGDTEHLLWCHTFAVFLRKLQLGVAVRNAHKDFSKQVDNTQRTSLPVPCRSLALSLSLYMDWLCCLADIFFHQIQGTCLSFWLTPLDKLYSLDVQHSTYISWHWYDVTGHNSFQSNKFVISYPQHRHAQT